MATNMDFLDSPFCPNQFLADYLDKDYRDDEIFSSFMEKLTSNIDFFARFTRTDISNFFSQLPIEFKYFIHASLSEMVLVHFKLSDHYKTRSNFKEDILYDDLYDFCQILVANEDVIQSYEFSRNFQKTSPKQKNLNSILEDNLDNLLKEVNPKRGPQKGIKKPRGNQNIK